MGKQGGQGKGKPKKDDRHFGRALIKMQQQGAQGRFGTRTAAPKGVDSILDNNNLDDFIAIAEMEGHEFEVQRPGHDDLQIIDSTEAEKSQSLHLQNFDFSHLTFPKKPKWTASMTAEEIDRNEKQAFLEWRRKLAQLESAHNFNIKLTPFEKNLDVWRQLWRVTERANVLLQVVDARNPLLYFTRELMDHVATMNPPRRMLIVLNKSDLLTEFQRSCWAEYFTQQGIPFLFYSARREEIRLNNKDCPLNLHFDAETYPDEELLAQNLLKMWAQGAVVESKDADADHGSDDEEEEEEDEDDEEEGNTADDNEEEEEDYEVVWGDGHAAEKSAAAAVQAPKMDSTVNKVLNREGFLYVLHALARAIPTHPAQLRANSNRFCIGMVGYPNVGKSSLINTLLGVSKSSHGTVRVGVSSTPGKTKHFQTLVLSDAVLLCDCPGLVFPSIMSSAAEMLCSGTLPINQMRDHLGPAAVILSRVPSHWLEALYGLQIVRVLDALDSPQRPPTPSEFLSAYCKLKTYVTSGPGGRWDEFRACKEVLKDFTDGRILYVAVPPHLAAQSRDAQSAFTQQWLRETENIMTQNERMAERLVVNKLKQLDLGEAEERAEEAGEEMVFPGEYEFVDESAANDLNDADEAVAVEIGAGGKPKRDHKRMKTWGKKGRKLRDKNPYESEDPSQTSYVAHTTSRQQSKCTLIKGRS